MAITAVQSHPTAPPVADRQRRSRGDAGFSLIELMFVAGLSAVLMGMAVMVVQSAAYFSKSNAAMTAVKAQLIEARDTALAIRRTVEVRFVNNNEVQLIRYNPDGTLTTIGGAVLEGQNGFRLFPGLPDSPDGFGNQAPLSFQNAAPPYLFTADGTFVDAAGVPLSGSVFLGITNQPNTARVVTVFGGTGRVTGYFWTGTQWHH